MQTLRNILASELRSRETIREWLDNLQPFQVPLNELQKYFQGEIPAGHVIGGGFPPGVLKLRRGVDTRLLLLVGLPGVGKTTLGVVLAAFSAKSGDKVIIFSRKGYQFTPLLSLSDLGFFDMLPKDIRLNPFVSPTEKISKEEWYSRVANVISTEGWMLYSSGVNFHKTISSYAEQHPTDLITPSRLIEFIKARKAYKLLDVDEKVRNRLEALTTGPAKKMFDTNEVFNFEFYARNNFNFRLDALTDRQTVYFISVWLEMLICYKQYSNDSSHHHVLLDDFFDLVTEGESAGRMSELLKTIMIHGRQLKIDLWVVAQSSFGLSKYLLDNISTVINFRTGELSDETMRNVTGLNEREATLLKKCPRGFCAVNKRFLHV